MPGRLSPPTASSPPSFLLPLFHLSWGCDVLILLFNVVFYSGAAALTWTEVREATRTEVEREGGEEASDRGSMQRKGGIEKETWLGRRRWMMCHERAVYCNLFFSICVMRYLFSCDANDFSSSSVLQSNVLSSRRFFYFYTFWSVWLDTLKLHTSRIVYQSYILEGKDNKSFWHWVTQEWTLAVLEKQDWKWTPDFLLSSVWPTSMSAFRRRRRSKCSTESIYDMLQPVSPAERVCVRARLYCGYDYSADYVTVPAVPRFSCQWSNPF